jgi:hypothetical protein
MKRVQCEFEVPDNVKPFMTTPVRFEFNAWTQADAEEDDKVFGSCPYKDNVRQCLPQPNLHGMGEGLTQKLNSGIVEELVTEAHRSLGMKATKVRSIRANVTCFHTRNVHVRLRRSL